MPSDIVFLSAGGPVRPSRLSVPGASAPKVSRAQYIAWAQKTMRDYVNQRIIPAMRREARAKGLSLSAKDVQAIHKGALELNLAAMKGDEGPMTTLQIMRDSGLSRPLWPLAAHLADEGHLSKGGFFGRGKGSLFHVIQQIPLVGHSIARVVNQPGKANLKDYLSTVAIPAAVAFGPEILSAAGSGIGAIASAGSEAIGGLGGLVSKSLGMLSGGGGKILSSFGNGVVQAGRDIYSGISSELSSGASSFMSGLRSTDPALASQMSSWASAIGSAQPGKWLARSGGNFYKFVKDAAGKLHITKYLASAVPPGIASQLSDGEIAPAPNNLFAGSQTPAGQAPPGYDPNAGSYNQNQNQPGYGVVPAGYPVGGYSNPGEWGATQSASDTGAMGAALVQMAGDLAKKKGVKQAGFSGVEMVILAGAAVTVMAVFLKGGGITHPMYKGGRRRR